MASNVDQGQVDANWRKAMKPEEKQRVKQIEERRGRRSQTDAEDAAELHRIMRRCIKRNRRKDGKE